MGRYRVTCDSYSRPRPIRAGLAPNSANIIIDSVVQKIDSASNYIVLNTLAYLILVLFRLVKPSEVSSDDFEQGSGYVG